MKRLLLTSAGFENPELARHFLKEADISAEKIRVMFITAAAADEEAKAMLPKCRRDLLDCGIPAENIVAYDLERPLKENEINGFQAVYVCGGSAERLLERMNAAGFREALEAGFTRGIIYIGVSAGSVVCGKSLAGNLGYCNKKIGVHADVGNWGEDYVNLTDSQALWICGSEETVLPKPKNPVDSRCGLHCTGCSYKKTCGCGGCIETDGHPFHGECPVAMCCQNNGFEHCGECEKMPCALLTSYSCDPEHGDNPHGARIEQCKRWRTKM